MNTERENPSNMRDYEEARRNFTWQVPEQFNYARDVVDAWAKRDPQKVALVAVGGTGEDTRHFTFSDLMKASNRVANFLDSLGAVKGDRVLVMLPRIPEWYFVMLGCFKLGVVPVPSTPMLTSRDLAYRLAESDASVLVTDEQGVAKAEVIRQDCGSVRHFIHIGLGSTPWQSLEEGMERGSESPPTVAPTLPTDPLLLYFTSGTVGHPKMVLHTHASYGIGHDVTARYWQDLRANDIHWTVSDTGWAKAAWGKLFGQWRVGAAVFLWDVRGTPDLELLLRLIGAQNVTTFCAPPTLYRSLILLDLHKFDWSRLRHCVAAGEPLNPEVIKVWREATGRTIYDGYGQTETVNVVANYRCLPVRPGSMGKPAPGFTVEVIDESGEVMEPGGEGDLAISVSPDRPVGLFAGYWRDEGATENAIRGDWYVTGDRAAKDEEGYLWFVGRADDVIISSGYRIGPFEVESALVEHQAVAEAAVVGTPDSKRGEIVKAFVVLAPGFASSESLAEDLQEHVKSVTAPYKYPRQVAFVDELPKTISGKIRRVELRRQERAYDRPADQNDAGSPSA